VGTFTVPVRISDISGQRSLTIDMVVDTGATMSLIPQRILRQLGVQPRRQMRFRPADESVKVLNVAEALLGVNGSEGIVPIAFGPDDAEPLLGAIALEAFGLAADPVNQRLIDVDGKLKLLWIFAGK
jgi:aspartyl protease family protein